MIHEKCINPRPKQPWQVDEDVALACVPESGWIQDMMDLMTYCTDAPPWFHLGAILTTLSTAAGKASLKVQRKDGGYTTRGFQLWSAIIGHSGTRKTQSADIAVKILTNAQPSLIMPSDGSVEGLHDALAEKQRDGVGLYYPDELSHMLDAASRNYSRNFNNWLLQTYRGGLMNRALVKKKGDDESKVIREILEPRLSILGSIPPRVLQVKTDKGMWSSGFMARFLFWGARRTWYSDGESDDPSVEVALSAWLKRIIVNRRTTVIVPYELGQPVFSWIRANVEDKDLGANDDVTSTLTRLQHKIFQVIGLISISKRTTPCDTVMTVSAEDVACGIKILKAMYGTFWALFAEVSGYIEGTQEQAVLRYIASSPRSTRKEISDALNEVTPRNLHQMLHQLAEEGMLLEEAKKREGRGRRVILYTLSEDAQEHLLNIL